jgi:NAD-binding of NADP-dependent 3-hydroxyisobutyrate dehydrogenase
MSETPGFIGLGNMGAGFRLALSLKDVNLIMQTAASSMTPMPLGSLLHDRYVSAVAKGRGDLDWSAIALGVAEDAGLALRKAAG